MNPKSMIITGGRVIDPAQNIDRITDVLISDGRIVDVTERPMTEPSDGYDVVDATGLVVSPGFVDLHTHLREPGFEHKETIETGTRAAARGGFTTICAMPNTEPALDSPDSVAAMLRRTDVSPPFGCSQSARSRSAGQGRPFRLWRNLPRPDASDSAMTATRCLTMC